MAEIVRRMARMDVQETIPWFSNLETLEEKKGNMSRRQQVKESHGWLSSGSEDDFMIDEDDDFEMEEAESKLHARDVTLLRNSDMTGNQLKNEMFTYLKTLEAREGDVSQKQKEEAESKLDAMLSNLTCRNEDTLEAALNDKDEIADDLEDLVLRLKQVKRCYFTMIVFSALYGRWMVHSKRRYYQECAKKGLTKFNEQKATNFVLDKSSCRANWHLHLGRINYWHVNFEATDDQETCTFFAELEDNYEDPMLLRVCVMLDIRAGVTTHCEFCRPKAGISHPNDVPLALSNVNVSLGRNDLC